METARVTADGVCELVEDDGVRVTWSTSSGWATAWREEWVREDYGPASEFIHALTDQGVDGVVDLLVVLADAAAEDPEHLGWVGAGPLEDVLSHSGDGMRAVDQVEAAARLHPAFRAALSSVRLGHHVDAHVRERLTVLGVRDLTRPG
jgi:hypothetical protein